MKTLLLLRHAKSSWADPTENDHARPLNDRGRRAAPMIGRLLRERELVPDHILTSTAVRARSTAEIVAEASGFAGAFERLDALYLAAPSMIATVVAEYAGKAERVLVVAHNPGIESFVEAASGESEPMPTAALAHFELPIEAWSDLVLDRSAELCDVWRPREIED